MMGLEPRRLIRHEAIAIGVALVEGIVSEGLDDVEQRGTERVAIARGHTTLHELDPLLGN